MADLELNQTDRSRPRAANRGWIVTFAGTRHQPRPRHPLRLEPDQGRHREGIRLEGRPAQRPLCPVLPGLRLRDDPGRAVPGQVRPAPHRVHRRPARRRGIPALLDHQQLRRLAARLRRAGRHRHRLRLLLRHAARAEVVPARQDRPDRRTGRGGLRPGPGLSGADVAISAGAFRRPEDHAHPRHRLRGHRVRPGAVAGEPAGGLRGRRQAGRRKGSGQARGRQRHPRPDPALARCSTCCG